MGSIISTNGRATPIPPTQSRTLITPQSYIWCRPPRNRSEYIFASRTKDKFGINSTDESEPTQFLKVGDVIRGTDFKIMKFTEKKERNQYGMKMDVSELLLEHQQNHAQLTLVKGQVATSPQSVATFVYTWGGRKEFEVRKDQEFPLATAEGNRTYKLIDVHPDKAVIAKHAKSRCADRDRLREPVNILTTDYTDMTNGAQSALECGAAVPLWILYHEMERSTEQIRIGQNAQD